MEAARDAVDVVESQFTLLARTVESLARRSSVYGGLDRAGYLILRTLADGGCAGIREIADRLGLDASTVTRQVATMEARGLIGRAPDPDDRRAAIVDLTASGRTAMAEARRQRQELIRSLFADWPEAELAALGRTLDRLNRTLAAAARL
jgi:DNA-binding MarR family transcriptional regulator